VRVGRGSQSSQLSASELEDTTAAGVSGETTLAVASCALLGSCVSSCSVTSSDSEAHEQDYFV